MIIPIKMLISERYLLNIDKIDDKSQYLFEQKNQTKERKEKAISKNIHVMWDENRKGVETEIAVRHVRSERLIIIIIIHSAYSPHFFG